MTNSALKARYWSESLSYKIKNKFQAKSDDLTYIVWHF